MILAGNAVEFLNRHALHRYQMSLCKLKQTLSKVAVEILFDQQLIDSTARLDSFDSRMYSKNIITRFQNSYYLVSS